MWADASGRVRAARVNEAVVEPGEPPARPAAFTDLVTITIGLWSRAMRSSLLSLHRDNP